MNLGLKSSSLLGRPTAALPLVLEERLLNEDDLRSHATRAGRTAPGISSLQRLTDRHRKMARHVAAGASNIEVACAAGCTPARVVQLKNDPTFRDLVEHYRALNEMAADEVTKHTFDKLAGMTNTALDELNDRLEDDPSQFENSELRDLVKLGADRIGFGPTKQVDNNVNINFGDRLEAARRRVAQQSAPVIEGSVEDAEVIV